MEQHALITRQPIMNRLGKIVAYELNFKHDYTVELEPFNEYIKSCFLALMSEFNGSEPKWIMNEKLTFINVNEAALLDDYLLTLPSSKVVLELLNSVNPTDEVLHRCDHLKSLGYKIAIENPDLHNTFLGLVNKADFIKMDIKHIPDDFEKKLLRDYFAKDAKIIIENLSSMEHFLECKEYEFDLFQGPFFMDNSHKKGKSTNPSFDSLFNVLNKLSQDAPVKDIEDEFKLDATLTFKLLRYINSVGFGLSCEIQSINHALSILGRKKLYRWISLLLVTAGENETSPALIKTSVARGRLTELLGETYFDEAEKDNLFVLGVFSLLDKILNTSMDDVVDKVNLKESIKEALMERGGVYGPFLELAEACENDDSDRIMDLSNQLQINVSSVNKKHMSALSWAEGKGF